MGLIRKTLGATLMVVTGGASYLHATTNLTTPLSADDELWSSKSFKKFNRHRNPSIQDICWKSLPISDVRPELRDNEEALTIEFCRGAWAGYAYAPQRTIMAYTNKGPKTENQLFDEQQLASSKYELGTRFSDHFEVVERTRNSVMLRGGGSPLEPGPREVDGLFVINAKLNKQAGTVDVGLKTVFFNSAEATGKKPAPFLVELLHRYYARAMVDDGARRLTRKGP
ncbi:uncharacterized protein GGS22DRAFT_158902 [Annulohypoxylon maeteangense]|uniref:uncharacterized protein n=1 Tax=Annulohypoxylon maeteangense TaxID=1927788 RepID=UPI002007B824|nr:uncharacterized protein GGS22DRAFT_158902 [Annulohypoxylon maeteangense]KAI0886872.1 hypothetical protein GGS22DRAFT_158902 [Annulohypoxylon maeteangense]